jgi:hypothetical protein
MNPVVNKFLFPNPKPSYTKTQYENLLYIPRDYALFNKKPDNYKLEKEGIPCLYFQSQVQNSTYILYSHGNACDLGNIHKDLVRFSNNFYV